MTDFDFGAHVADAEAFHPATVEALPKGNYICKITDLENTSSSGGYPMLKITLENESGRQWDNLVISPNEFSVAKLLGLIDAAKLPRPDVAKGEIDPQTGALSEPYAHLLRGQEVGVIVRDEEDNREDHVGEWRPRVRGYVDPGVLTPATTGPMGGSQAGSQTQNSKPSNASPLAF
jgi:hypothetical protein